MYLVYNNDLFLPNDSSLVNVFIFILFGVYSYKKYYLPDASEYNCSY